VILRRSLVAGRRSPWTGGIAGHETLSSSATGDRRPATTDHADAATALLSASLRSAHLMKKFGILAAAMILAVSCSKEQAIEAKDNVAEKVSNAKDRVVDAVDDITTPTGKAEDPKAREQERFDARWRQLQSFRAQQKLKQQQQQQAAAAAKAVQVQFVKGQKQSFKGLDWNAINASSVSVPISGDMSGPSVLKAQVYLDRVHYSVGVIDGRWGKNSAISVWWWQRAHGLEGTGDVDEATFRSLAQAAGGVPPVMQHQLTAADIEGPFTQIPEDVYDQQDLKCLCYESLREKLAERFHASEDFLELLNPNVKFSDLQAGQSINVPNVREQLQNEPHDVARIVVSIVGNSLNGFDANGNLVFHAPTTLGSTFDPSPDETVKMVKAIENPHFHYNPKLYSEVSDDKPDAHLNPGPNSPVGVVWMALSKPHYGIHGTKDPDAIGYASSHGCVRLTNWDAEELRRRINPGIEVEFVDTRGGGAPQNAESGEPDKKAK
jgi:lipoprotein-anchoring transpeptidase ErfK/SrfK